MAEPGISNLCSVRQLAREFGYASTTTLLRAAKSGRLRAVRPGLEWLSTPAWVAEYQGSLGARGKPRGGRAGGVTQRQREVLDAVKRLQPAEGEPGVTLGTVASALGIDRGLASRRLAALTRIGLVRNLQTVGPGAPARFVVCDEEP